MTDNQKIQILGISGSLKSTSSNSNILRSIAAQAPMHVLVKIYNDLESIPPFNPDQENEYRSVDKLRAELKKADAVIICTPEYAFGVPGVLKNALDWLVSSGEFNEKPVASISASPLFSGGDKALASLRLTLTALGTKNNDLLSLSINNITNKINTTGEVTDTEALAKVNSILNELIKQIHTR